MNKNSITIEELARYLKDGWVAMNYRGDWEWFDEGVEPTIGWLRNEIECVNAWQGDLCRLWLTCLNIAPVADWRKSKRHVVGGKIVRDLLEEA